MSTWDAANNGSIKYTHNPLTTGNNSQTQRTHKTEDDMLMSFGASQAATANGTQEQQGPSEAEKAAIQADLEKDQNYYAELYDGLQRGDQNAIAEIMDLELRPILPEGAPFAEETNMLTANFASLKLQVQDLGYTEEAEKSANPEAAGQIAAGESESTGAIASTNPTDDADKVAFGTSQTSDVGKVLSAIDLDIVSNLEGTDQEAAIQIAQMAQQLGYNDISILDTLSYVRDARDELAAQAASSAAIA